MPRNEWQEAREELAADFRRFNNNEAAMEREHCASLDADAERKARLAKFAAEIAQMESDK